MSSSLKALAIRLAPSESATVATAGKASGMAATARLTAVNSMRVAGSPRRIPATKNTTQSAATTSANIRAKRAMRS